jgi:hypothetical protein
MIDIALALAFLGLPIAMWIITRDITWVVIRLFFALGVAGVAVQTAISFGWGMNLRSLQLIVFVLFVIVTILAIAKRSSGRSCSLHRQFVGVFVPAIAIGLFLLATRLAAPERPELLTGLGYLVNHPFAEDSAKWLNLSGQLASGRDLVFAGYAGGPLVMLMAVVAPFIAVASLLLLGGVNEVAVAVNTVIGLQFLAIALVPFALAPLVTARIPPAPRIRGSVGMRLPIPLVWVGVVVVGLASSVLTVYGHLSLQLVFLPMILWTATFLVMPRNRGALVLSSLAVVPLASAWFPLLGLTTALLIAIGVWTLIRRMWWYVGATLVTAVAASDAILSPAFYLLGIGVDTAPPDSDLVGEIEEVTLAPAPAQQAFAAGGGTEIAEPILGGLALLSIVAVIWWFGRSRAVQGWRQFAPFAPLGLFGSYLIAVIAVDGLTTATAPNYGAQKMTFAFVIIALGSTLPIALAALQQRAKGMTLLRWGASFAIIMLIAIDGLLPRALSALSPQLWPRVNADNPQYWALAEVRPVADQPIAGLPLACIHAGPGIPIPGGQPEGQRAYSCSRLLIGLSGLEGRAGPIPEWLSTDWFGNTSSWDRYREQFESDAYRIADRQLIFMDADGSVNGVGTIRGLLSRY